MRSDEHEVAFSRYLEEYVDEGRPGVLHLLARPRRTLSAVRALYALPELTAEPTATLEGRAVREGLSRPNARFRLAIHTATAVLVLPESAEQYTEGASKQTLRRKARIARKLGVEWATVDDPQERRRLLSSADEYERVNPREQYRDANPRNEDLLGIRQWLKATSGDGKPLLVCVVPVDGDWSVLRYFRTLDDGPDASAARYLMTQVLVEQLVGQGVRYLADTVSPTRLTSGLRHFQRMVGFRILRVRLRSARE